ncbi:hypothetical protein ALI22I_15520 [Saccharothrix sp. ALI-22-I]|uniref:toxin-antitoxin system YwqK family antitoxin n=1 Tax=Saccharothrix sp. ALI-22-I TaxID=1933778 RepID=UPI00097C49D4|nr:hypothetical protein [Saccharothrix sp. ALI-22-I]ONI89429.1 hypothetical protein ALI22I_15520 [Saccharothrix sp. ALI-22-I]
MRIDQDDTYVDDTQRVLHEGELFTGELETRDANGDLLELANYYEGVEHGVQEQWYPGGREKVQGISKMGKAVGDWYQWHPNGRLAVHRMFDDNGWPLHVKRWYAEGDLIQDEKLS